MIDEIRYTREPDNCREVVAFVGPVPPCPVCNDYGEYETEYGPRECNACNSRCVPLIDASGTRVLADWGDTIERRGDGLHLIRGEAAGEGEA